MSGIGREALWLGAASIHEEILRHPFLLGLADGTLPRASFRHYITQDSHYLRDFARSLEVLAQRAPTTVAAEMLRRHASGAIEVERSLHASFSDAWASLPPANPDCAPTTLFYGSWLLRASHEEEFAAAFAAHLPCYWIYQKVGRSLIARGSPDPLYARWISTYGGELFDEVVREALDLFESLWPQLAPSARVRCQQLFITAAKLEWHFWDAAWHLEGWKPDSKPTAPTDTHP